MKKFLLMTLLLIGLAPSMGLATTPVEGRDTCFEMDPESCEVFRLTNLERRKKGLAALRFSKRCHRMALDQSVDMAKHSYFSHTRPDGTTFWERVLRFQLQRGAAENIAVNRSAAGAVQAWMKSPGHRKNILDPNYKSFAVGQEQSLYTQVFWVNLDDE